jgi:hypothetical protein
MSENETTPSTDTTPQKHTVAYTRFDYSLWRTQELLEAGLSGLANKVEGLDELIEKFKIAHEVPGPVPKDYEPDVQIHPQDDSERFTLTLDGGSAWLCRKTLEASRAEQRKLRFHLYSILTVAIWGAFETYAVMLFEELYRERPQLLKSSEVITFEQVIDHDMDVVDYLIERQLDKIGHFTLRETLKYMEDRIGFQFSTAVQRRLDDLYLVRNIIAHNTGIVRSDVRDRVPKSLGITNNELRITKAFLESMMNTIRKSVQAIEEHVVKKFYRD